MSCNHAAHNWNVVYQCRNCNEIVPEEIAEGYLAKLEADNGTMRVALKNIAGQAQIQYELGIGTRAEAKYILDKCHDALEASK